MIYGQECTDEEEEEEDNEELESREVQFRSASNMVAPLDSEGTETEETGQPQYAWQEGANNQDDESEDEN